jgi:hypothetical protein
MAHAALVMKKAKHEYRYPGTDQDVGEYVRRPALSPGSRIPTCDDDEAANTRDKDAQHGEGVHHRREFFA